MLREEIKQLKTGRPELRKFGLLVGGVLVVVGLTLLARSKPHVAAFLAPGVALVALGLLFPKALKPVYLVWMSLALVLGLVVSHVVLTLFFYLVITPIGLVARCAGKDFLRRKLEPRAPTYWIRRERTSGKSPADYERQF
jgi:hypothetical protein